MAAAQGGARVLHGFEEPARVGQEMMERGQQLVFLVPGHTFEEFVPVMMADTRALAARGANQRVVVAGKADASLARELREVGVEVRSLDQEREVAFLATDREVMLFPAGQRPESPLTPCAIAVQDPVVVAHFRLAFERAWELAAPEAQGHRRQPA